MNAIGEETKWSTFSGVVEVLTGGHKERYAHEAAAALFFMKSWISSSQSLLVSLRSAPLIFGSLLVSEEMNKLKKQKEFLYKPLATVFNAALEKPDINEAITKIFGTRNIIEFLLKTTRRPYVVGKVKNKEREFDVKRLNEFTEWRMRLIKGGYNGTISDAELLLGKMHAEKAWKPSTIKQVRKRWEEKELFLFAAKMEEFSGILSFGDVKNGNIIELVELEAKNHRRYTNYFSRVKEIITQLTPEISKELAKDEVWGKLEIQLLSRLSLLVRMSSKKSTI